MYKELVDSIESNLKRFAEIPELEGYVSDKFNEQDNIITYDITRFDGELRVSVLINTSNYVFSGNNWELILARLKELWINE